MRLSFPMDTTSIPQSSPAPETHYRVQVTLFYRTPSSPSAHRDVVLIGSSPAEIIVALFAKCESLLSELVAGRATLRSRSVNVTGELWTGPDGTTDDMTDRDLSVAVERALGDDLSVDMAELGRMDADWGNGSYGCMSERSKNSLEAYERHIGSLDGVGGAYRWHYRNGTFDCKDEIEAFVRAYRAEPRPFATDVGLCFDVLWSAIRERFASSAFPQRIDMHLEEVMNDPDYHGWYVVIISNTQDCPFYGDGVTLIAAGRATTPACAICAAFLAMKEATIATE